MKKLQQGFVRMNNIDKEYRKHVPEIIQSYIGNLSEITAIDSKYFMDILNRIDYIKFSIDDEVCNLIDNEKFNTISFNIDNTTGIIVNEKLTAHPIYELTNELTHFFIDNELSYGILKERDLHIDKENSRLYQGIAEYITQEVWKNDDVDISELDSIKYFYEVETANFLIGAMGKKDFYYYIFTNPNHIFDTIKSIRYEDDSLLNYVESKMKQLIRYRGKYDKSKVDDEQIMDGIEAITDRAKELKLKKY